MNWLPRLPTTHGLSSQLQDAADDPAKLLFRKESKVEQLTEVFVFWSVLLVPALAAWAIFGINVCRETQLQPYVDSLYFLIMLVIGGLTWRTMENHDACFLIHTLSLGIMIVFGVLPRRQPTEESVQWDVA